MSKNKVTEKYIEFNTDDIPHLVRRGVLDEFSSCWNRKNPNKTFYLKETKQWKDGTIRKQVTELNNAEKTQKKVAEKKKVSAQKQNEMIGTLLFILIGTPIVLLIMIGGLGSGGSSGGSSYSGSSAGYNDSVPSGMSRAESNYIGNSLSEEGYSEQEAKEMRALIHAFNELQD